jgi:uncharacterized peroxidase-related enzyme
MPDFQIHTLDDAPEPSRETLRSVRGSFGFIPNLMAILSEAPAALKAYSTLTDLLTETSFTPAERQVAALSVSYVNRCGYCMAAHSTVARVVGVPGTVIAALREGKPLPDEKLEALRRFTTAVVQKRGQVSESEVQSFLAAGFQKSQIFEVLVAVALKTISNYADHIAHVPVDRQFERSRWTAPASGEDELAAVASARE